MVIVIGFALLYLIQVPATDRNALSSLWGKLASEILMQNWDAAMEDLTRLKETIDNNVSKSLIVLNREEGELSRGEGEMCCQFLKHFLCTTSHFALIDIAFKLFFCQEVLELSLSHVQTSSIIRKVT